MVIVEHKSHWYEKRIRFTAETPRTQRVKVQSPLGKELRDERQITFEEAVFCLMHGGLLDTIEHPNREKYPDQRIFIINVEDYVYLVPFVETEECIFLKTIIPSRKMTKKYLGGKKNETQ